MSIYATLWQLKFPKDGDSFLGCEWIRVTAQGVPAHIGSPTPSAGYENGDPYGSFLPPPLELDEHGDAEYLRAVVFVTEGTQKGTARSGQEYVDPLLVISGAAYAEMSFGDLHEQLRQALRGSKPSILVQELRPNGTITLYRDDGTVEKQDLS